MDSNDVTYQIVWRNVDERLTGELTDFWLAQGALPTREVARKRAPSVAMVARDAGGQIVGVSSLFAQQWPRLLNNMLYGYRSFVVPGRRRSSVALELAKRVTDYLEGEFVSGRSRECIGMVIVVENPELARGWPLAVDPRLPHVFVGTDERGMHVRVHYFSGAKIVSD